MEIKEELDPKANLNLAAGSGTAISTNEVFSTLVHPELVVLVVTSLGWLCSKCNKSHDFGSGESMEDHLLRIHDINTQSKGSGQSKEGPEHHICDGDANTQAEVPSVSVESLLDTDTRGNGSGEKDGGGLQVSEMPLNHEYAARPSKAFSAPSSRGRRRKQTAKSVEADKSKKPKLDETVALLVASTSSPSQQVTSSASANSESTEAAKLFPDTRRAMQPGVVLHRQTSQRIQRLRKSPKCCEPLVSTKPEAVQAGRTSRASVRLRVKPVQRNLVSRSRDKKQVVVTSGDTSAVVSTLLEKYVSTLDSEVTASATLCTAEADQQETDELNPNGRMARVTKEEIEAANSDQLADLQTSPGLCLQSYSQVSQDSPNEMPPKPSNCGMNLPGLSGALRSISGDVLVPESRLDTESQSKQDPDACSSIQGSDSQVVTHKSESELDEFSGRLSGLFSSPVSFFTGLISRESDAVPGTNPLREMYSETQSNCLKTENNCINNTITGQDSAKQITAKTSSEPCISTDATGPGDAKSPTPTPLELWHDSSVVSHDETATGTYTIIRNDLESNTHTGAKNTSVAVRPVSVAEHPGLPDAPLIPRSGSPGTLTEAVSARSEKLMKPIGDSSSTVEYRNYNSSSSPSSACKDPVGDCVQNEVRLACDFCEHSFSDTQSLQMHSKHYKGQKPVKCKTCQAKFHNLDLLNVHIYYDHETESIPHCLTCKKVMHKRRSLLEHIVFMHATSKGLKPNQVRRDSMLLFQCAMCQMKMVNDPRTVESHANAHKKDDFRCHICGQGFRLKYLLQAHTHAEHNLDKCGTEFETGMLPDVYHQVTELIQREQARLRGPKTLRCRVCDKVMSGKAFNMLKHLVKHYRPRKLDKETPMYYCHDCKKEVPDVGESVHYHRLMHGHIDSSNSKLKCSICGACFISEGLRRRHEDTVHKFDLDQNASERDKKSMCEMCGKEFVSKALLQRHVKRHSEEKGLFSCDICNKSYELQSVLDAHRAKHEAAGEVTPCPHCQKQYMCQKALARHVQVNLAALTVTPSLCFSARSHSHSHTVCCCFSLQFTIISCSNFD